MGLYLRESLELYFRHWKLLIPLALVLALITGGALATRANVGKSAIVTFVSVLVVVYAYKKILKTYKDTKDLFISAIMGWVALTLVEIAMIVLVLISVALILFLGGVGIVLFLAVFTAALLYVVKFMYIPVLAARGKDALEILRDCVKANWGVAIRAVIGQLILTILFWSIPTILLISAVGPLIPTIMTTKSTAILLQSTAVVAALILSAIIYVVAAPIFWMFPLASAKDALSEREE